MQKYALLVGINKYSGSLGKLAFCHNDMNALKIRLLAAGFPPENVVFLNEEEQDANLYPSKANIEAQLRLRMSIASRNDLFLVAFSGHGLHIDGQSYFCPIDAKLDDAEGTMVAVNDIYTGLQNCKAAQRLMVIDACRNDPTRGLKAARSTDLTLGKPPSGVRVLSSCEAGQYSMEDPKLKHGVFMYYVTKGLEGLADVEAEGNKNGKITLDELYYFAHEKTKTHVANAYVLPQTPVLRGEVIGPFELALVPDREKLERELAKEDERVKLASVEPIKPGPATPQKSEPAPASSVNSGQASSNPMGDAKPPQPRDLSHPLLTQGNIYFQQGDYDHAVNSFTALIEDGDVAAGVRRQARLARGSVYLALGGRENVQRALTDQKAAGMATISMTIVKPSENLMVTSQVKGTVRQNEVVDIGMINGDWLWVASVGGNAAKQGYIKWDAVLAPPAAAAPAPVAKPAAQSVQQAAFQSQGTKRGAGQSFQTQNFQPGRTSYNDNYRDPPGLRAEYRNYDTQSNKLDRMYDRNASQGAIRAQERRVEQHERRIDRMESRGGRNR
jgi:hypothetical protein